MPELPEVETVKRGLNKLIVGRKVQTVSSDTARSFPNSKTDVNLFLIKAEVTGVRRRAKVLMIDLSSGYTLVIHLKMTGQLVFVGASTSIPSERLRAGTDKGPGALSASGCRCSDETEVQPPRYGGGHPNDSLVCSLPDKSTRVTFEFDDGSHLYFNDQRKFGWVRLIPTPEVPNIDFMKRVGPEPLEADFTAEQFAARFTRRARTTIKAAILDQSVIAGVGNIYADEALWGAKIHPARLAGAITNAEFKKLYTEVRAVMNLSIEKGGSTNRNYVDAEGRRGSYMDFARVFRREGLDCPRCSAEIIKIRVAGRGTHICPACQVIGR
ncbi:MAG: bifunctional DNA-formamidopyrimidine glycosylase/DNA-(apurinic or apyrimidinic site) lyase [Candidatus Saccharimonadales bacterium]